MRWPLTIILLLGLAPLRAKDLAPLAPREMDKSPQPALTIDNWQPKEVPRPPVQEPEPMEEPPAPAQEEVAKPAPPPAAPAAPTDTPLSLAPPASTAAPAVAMNEFVGVISNIDADARTIRITVEGGISPQLDWNEATLVLAKGRTIIKMDDLKTGDKVALRYTGRQLVAREIEKL